MLSVILTFQFMNCPQISVYNMYKKYATQETAVTYLVMFTLWYAHFKG